MPFYYKRRDYKSYIIRFDIKIDECLILIFNTYELISISVFFTGTKILINGYTNISFMFVIILKRNEIEMEMMQ